MLIPSTTVSSFSFRVFFVNSHISPIMCHICFSSSFRPSHPPRVLSSFPNVSRSNSFAYKFPNFHPLFFRPIGWKFQGSNLPIYLFLLSLSSLSVSHFEPDGNTKIRISKFPSLFYFYPLFFRSIEWKFQGSNLPTNLRHLFLLSPSLSLSPLDSMKIPRFEFIQTFKFPNFHLPRFLFTRSDERWPKLGQRTNPFPLLLSSSSSSIRPNLFSSSCRPLSSAALRFEGRDSSRGSFRRNQASSRRIMDLRFRESPAPIEI